MLPTDEMEGLVKVQELTNNTHTIELFTDSGQLKTGYNAISLRIKDHATNGFVNRAALSWMPMMQMQDMAHSGPASTLAKADGKDTVYEGYIIFQMANLDGSGWSLQIDYTIDGVDYTATSNLVVTQNANQNVTSFTGADETHYVLALIAPQEPKIAVNKMKVALFKMETMHSFLPVANYRLALDPRMPSMGNHSSPNNTDLIFDTATGWYHGDLSLTMTGYWVLNLKLFDADDHVLKGEDITEDHPKSTLFLELEF